jgi:hypothetical protein
LPRELIAHGKITHQDLTPPFIALGGIAVKIRANLLIGW